MKIRVFSADANPRVDAPLCRKSPSYVAQEVSAVPPRMFMLNDKEAQCITYSPRLTDEEMLVSASHETSVNASITEREMEANVGIAETKGAVLRAQAKIKAWMSKDTDDTRSPLPRGSWINPQNIQVVVVQ
jgi:hypothetical protein